MTTFQEELAKKHSQELLFADGYDEAVLGVSLDGKVIYDVEIMLEITMEMLDAIYDEAWEYLEFNTFGAYVGEKTPIYIHRNE